MLQEAAWGKACKVEGPHFRDLGMRSVTWNKVQEMAAWDAGLRDPRSGVCPKSNGELTQVLQGL